MNKLRFQIEVLLAYALNKSLIQPEDCYYMRNLLLALCGEEEPFGEIDAAGRPCAAAFEVAETLCPDDVHTPAPVLEPLLDMLCEKGIIEENTTGYRDLMDARIMGLLTKRPSDFVRTFESLAAFDAEAATNYFYRMQQNNHYIMQDRIDKNLYWPAQTRYGELEITVNLSKPEKDPKEVARLRNVKSSTYPKCLLCPENQGYWGRFNHAARQNIRQLPLELAGENWYVQYSPYSYYNEHCIVLKEEHVPMNITEKTFTRLFDFLDRFPHYFLGSNAGLPVVGGSMPFHEHYQGGRHHFPMEKARVLSTRELGDVTLEHIEWPLTTIRLRGADRAEVEAVATRILNAWTSYSNEELGIIAADPDGTPHNAITPIARMRGPLYELDLALRNNQTSEEYPLGIYHPHPEYHHIKKENIGLIEVMGLAVLPGRLQNELKLIAEILCGARTDRPECLEKHEPWIQELVAAHGTKMTPEEADALLRAEVGRIFGEVLACCGVFPENEKGRAALNSFIASI